MTTLFGIKNCDSVKKAQKWLKNQSIDYRFHDFRGDGIDKKLLQGWIKTLGWEGLVNKRSSTWKSLDESTKNSLNDRSVVPVILAQPTLIKRPVLTYNDHILIGFNTEEYAALF